MGRKTADALGRALPGRRNLVMGRSGRVPFEGMEPVASLQEAMDATGGEELMVIGGGEIFALALPFASTLLLTHVDTVVADADAFFPPFDLSEWMVTRREVHAADARHDLAFEFVDYQRISRPDGSR